LTKVLGPDLEDLVMIPLVALEILSVVQVDLELVVLGPISTLKIFFEDSQVDDEADQVGEVLSSIKRSWWEIISRCRPVCLSWRLQKERARASTSHL
jgi:hypothetical protein